MDGALHIVVIDPIGFLSVFSVLSTACWTPLPTPSPAGRQRPPVMGEANATRRRKTAHEGEPRAYVYVASRRRVILLDPLATNS